MIIKASKRAEEDLQWFGKHNPKLLLKIQSLIDDIEKDPYTGLGKPEKLKHELLGWYSRRITNEHRLVYKVDDSVEGKVLYIMQCRFHYD